MSSSILNDTKKALNVNVDDPDFDLDIKMHINTALSILHQLGVGPAAGFMIEDALPTWFDFIGNDNRYNMVKSFVYLRVRLTFDPPQTSHLVEAIKEQITELSWRLSVQREIDVYGDPVSVLPIVLEGGSA